MSGISGVSAKCWGGLPNKNGMEWQTGEADLYRACWRAPFLAAEAGPLRPFACFDNA